MSRGARQRGGLTTYNLPLVTGKGSFPPSPVGLLGQQQGDEQDGQRGRDLRAAERVERQRGELSQRRQRGSRRGWWEDGRRRVCAHLATENRGVGSVRYKRGENNKASRRDLAEGGGSLVELGNSDGLCSATAIHSCLFAHCRRFALLRWSSFKTPLSVTAGRVAARLGQLCEANLRRRRTRGIQ